MAIHLGRLKKVDLREFFKDEAKDFTPWLAEEENLELLGETLGLDIELEDTEVRIGKFSADIVGLDMSSNRTIIIENQLEKTNHDHLGKIITYGAGKDAGIVIWICKKIQQEHKTENGVEHFHFNKCKVYYKCDFENFSFKEIGYADYGDWNCFSSIVGEDEVKNLRKIYFDCDDYAETTWTVLLYHNFTYVTLVRE